MEFKQVLVKRTWSSSHGQTCLCRANRGKRLQKSRSVILSRYNSNMPPSTVSSRHFYQNQTLLDYASRPIRPVSLKQLAYFGRKLSDDKIIQSANFVRQEIPTRMARRIHDMQSLPYVIVRNTHISSVYELYYDSFNAIRRFPIIKTMEDNARFCDVLGELLTFHTAVIPHLVMGVIECADEIEQSRMDKFMDSMLRSRISRRVMTEQHIAMTDAYIHGTRKNSLGQVNQGFLQCGAESIVQHCDALARKLASSLHDNVPLPQLKFEGDISVKFAYVESHLKYMIGEILRNTFEGAVEVYKATGKVIDPILVTIVDAPEHVIFRFSDKAGGMPQDIIPYLWSFAKGPRSATRHQNFKQVPVLEGIIEELETSVAEATDQKKPISSLASLTSRSPLLRLGMGLPMSKIYAEFWGGSISIKSIEGYGCDVFLHLSKLGNENSFVETHNI
ncbi:branched-chain alpha-ketoacid dehydrogenase kinase [Lipomyces arxii]|uniref:branched-chain alpha-ketoacid dehydrogenase kinase n=1 Tax=Lipomyces arxii TaxID=56418 RepID=UPI0034CD3B49